MRARNPGEDVGRRCRKRKRGEEARGIMEGGGSSSGEGRRATRRKNDGADGGRGRGNCVKRMPTSLSDTTVGKVDDIYACEKIVGQRRAKGGVIQWKVKWVGYGSKQNTWEPIEHLAGCEKLIAEFQERERTRIAQIEGAKPMEKGTAATTAAAAAAAAVAAPFVAHVD